MSLLWNEFAMEPDNFCGTSLNVFWDEFTMETMERVKFNLSDLLSTDQMCFILFSFIEKNLSFKDR